MKFTEWLDVQPSYGLCNPPMSPYEALDFLCEYLIPGEYDPLPEGSDQTNTYLVYTILYKYSRKFRRELTYRAKKNRRGMFYEKDQARAIRLQPVCRNK